MRKPLKKDVYKEIKIGKKQLTAVSITVMIISIALIATGIVVGVLGAINHVGAWQIIWRVLLGVVTFIIGAILLGVGITMFAVTRSMLNIDEGNVADGNRAFGTVNVYKCDKCGTKLDDEAKFCPVCGKTIEVAVCEKCGKEIPNDAKFCKECGEGVDKN